MPSLAALALLLNSSSPVHALGPAPVQGQLAAPVVTLEPAGPGDPDRISVRLEASVAYTLRRIEWRGIEVLKPAGFNGQVVWYNGTGTPVGWVGSGHLEGGAELVESLALTVDGVPVELGPGFAGTTYAESFHLRKESTLETLTGVRSKLYAEMAFEGGELMESARIVFTEDADVKLMYGFMHTWPDTSSEWAAERRSDGQVLQGAFVLGGSQANVVIDEDVEWIGTLYPSSGHVAVTKLHAANPNVNGLRHLFVDNTTYHKQYYATIGDDVLMPAGSTFAFAMSTSFHPEPAGQDWKLLADAQADLLGPALLVDADLDQLPDAWELGYVTSLAVLAAGGDLDGDGASDLVELHAGSDPTDPADVPTLLGWLRWALLP